MEIPPASGPEPISVAPVSAAQTVTNSSILDLFDAPALSQAKAIITPAQDNIDMPANAVLALA